MTFIKGQSGNLKGRGKGTPNKITKTVKETVLAVFTKLQDDPKHNLTQFAKKFPRDFYTIAAKLIPTEVKGEVEVSGIKTLIIEPVARKPNKDK